MKSKTLLAGSLHDSMESDHVRLLHLAEELDRALDSRAASPIAEELFQDLCRQTREHFAWEEREMQQHGYPDADRHIREHQEALAWLAYLEQQLAESSGIPQALADATTVLRTWIHEHLPRYDQPLSTFLLRTSVATTTSVVSKTGTLTVTP